MKRIITLTFVIISLQSCGVLIWRKVKCKEYKISSEKFWFQGKLDSKYILINNKTKEEKVFSVYDKWIYVRNNYTSDTGCGCHDVTSQLLTTDKDEIFIKNDSWYVEKNKPNISDSYTFKFEKSNWTFDNKTSKISNGTIFINGTEIKTKTYSEVYKNISYILIIGEGVGVISVKLSDNEIWERKSLFIEEITSINEYRKIETDCN